MPSISTQDDVTNAQQENAQNSINKIKNDLTNIGSNNIDLSPAQTVDANQIIANNNTTTIAETIPHEITKNEEKKREHKDLLLKIVMWFLGVQFGLFFLLLTGVIVCLIIGHMIDKPFPTEMTTMIFDMLKIYLASIIVELISMLYFIVKNVFDTTIPDLAKQLTNNKNKD
ncbi:MAG: hypothetical protein UDG84_02160 [Thomasclavelia sp.]|jgi:hypothetical protein|nr:hypothetical protein [Thomasclavelia sp.]